MAGIADLAATEDIAMTKTALLLMFLIGAAGAISSYRQNKTIDDLRAKLAGTPCVIVTQDNTFHKYGKTPYLDTKSAQGIRVCGNVVDGEKINVCPDDKDSLPGGRNVPKP